jgi:hypothetical protein
MAPIHRADTTCFLAMSLKTFDPLSGRVCRSELEMAGKTKTYGVYAWIEGVIAKIGEVRGRDCTIAFNAAKAKLKRDDLWVKPLMKVYAKN